MRARGLWSSRWSSARCIVEVLLGLVEKGVRKQDTTITGLNPIAMNKLLDFRSIQRKQANCCEVLVLAIILRVCLSQRSYASCDIRTRKTEVVSRITEYYTGGNRITYTSNLIL